ncbi:WG repeat-containing protein [Flectobacillus roseus]|uniref:WG repeat-containing protein n=1 Tax=Flectobacillus roseus TaxID=502259 RepID=A0ABT6Y7L8_9BACT|nr:WG repeat-containing protein [Flectobacillus roseus]MDI9859553.1 WG repeat-containing protein [Flectobacillus roseus]
MTTNWFKAPYLNCQDFYFLPNGKAQIQVDGKWGLLDENGDFLEECTSSHPMHVLKLTPVQDTNGKWGLIDLQKKLIIPYEYDRIYKMFSSFYHLEKDNYVLLADLDGNILKTEYKIRFFSNTDFSDGLIGAVAWINESRDNAYGYIDESGNTIIPFIYDTSGHIGEFTNGLAPVCISDETPAIAWKTIFIDKNNNTVFRCPENWSNVHFDGEIGFAYLWDKKNYSFFDKNFNIIKDTTYDSVQFYHEFILVRCSETQKCSLLNRNLEALVSPEFDSLIPLDSNYLKVYNFCFKKTYKLPRKQWSSENVYILHGVYSISDQRLTVPLEYDWIEDMNEGFVRVSSGGKLGYVKYSGEPVTPIIFEAVKIVFKNRAWVKLDNKWGIIDLSDH